MTQVPFFRPAIGQEEIDEVVATLRSGWLTTGPRTARFEAEFAEAVGAEHALALNSCTAALHLAVEVLGLRPGQGVLLPTMTFAATAEVVRYLGAVPILVDCEPDTYNLDLADVERKIEDLRAGRLPADPDLELTGIVPVHVGGLMIDLEALGALARRHDLWVVEDAAHAFPAAWRRAPSEPWQRCGEKSSRIACFSFYANKTITTGEGGMAVSDDSDLIEHMRSLSLHGLSHDAWGRYTAQGSWDYRILAPGYKYNLTDIAAAIGIHQLPRSESFRQQREAIATELRHALSEVEELELPPLRNHENRIHSWHLFQVRLRLDRLRIDRDQFLRELRARGVGFSVHWRPLHLHPYYISLGWEPGHLPVAAESWLRSISLPIFPGMTPEEIRAVVDAVRNVCREHRRKSSDRG